MKFFLLAVFLLSATANHCSYEVPNGSPLPEPRAVGDNMMAASILYNGSKSDYSHHLINDEQIKRGLPGYPVFVVYPSTESPEIALRAKIDEVNQAFHPFASIASRDCGRSLLKYLTASLLPITYVVEDAKNPKTILPAIPSFELCNSVVESCHYPGFPFDTLKEKLKLPDCKTAKIDMKIDNAEFNGLYRNTSTDWTLGGKDGTETPVMNFKATPIYAVQCQPPLSFNQNSFNAGTPEPPCQDHCLGYLIYTENQWNTVKILSYVLSWVCIVADLNLMIVLLMAPKNRRYPGIMSVFMTIAGFLIDFPFCIASFIGLEDLLCNNQWEKATFSNGVCVWSACFILYGALLGLLTWSCLAINTYVTLHLRWKIDNFKWGIGTYFVTLGYPLVAVIVGCATRDLAFTPPIPWCWFKTEPLEWAIFYSVDILCCLVSLFCILFVLYELRNIQDSSKGKRAKYLKLLRVFAFLVLFFEIAVYMIAVQAELVANYNQYEAVNIEYYSCLLKNTETCPRPADGEGSIPVSQWYWLIVSAVCVGFPIVIVFGTTGPVFFFWCRAVSNYNAGKDIADGLTNSSSSASSGGSWAGPQEADEDSYDPDA